MSTRIQQAADTRAALLDAARRTFGTKGYLNTGITDITRAAGRSAGSFYNHFDGKQALLLALADEIGDDADNLIASSTADMRDIAPHLEVFWMLQSRHRDVIDALTDASLVSPEFADRVRAYAEEQLSPWIAVIAGLADRGATLPGSPEFTARLIGDLAKAFHDRWTGPSAAGLTALVEYVNRSLGQVTVEPTQHDEPASPGHDCGP